MSLRVGASSRHGGTTPAVALNSILREFGDSKFNPESHATELLAAYVTHQSHGSSEKAAADVSESGNVRASGIDSIVETNVQLKASQITWDSRDGQKEERESMDLESLQQAAFPDIAPLIARLQVQLEVISRSIHDNISLHHSDLIQQVTGIGDLSSQLKTVKDAVAALQGSVNRLKAKTTVPYNTLSGLTTQLSHVLLAADCLRKVIRFLSLHKRLSLQMKSAAAALPTQVLESGVPSTVTSSSSSVVPSREVELAAAALTIAEIEQLRANSDLSGISVVDAELEFIISSRHEIVSCADNIIDRVLGLKRTTELEHTSSAPVPHLTPPATSSDLAALSSALVIHRNLDRTFLPRRIHSTLSIIVEQVRDAWRAASDVPAISLAAGISPPGSGTPSTLKRTLTPGVPGPPFSSPGPTTSIYDPTTPPQSTAFTTHLWSRFDAAADATYAGFQRVLVLERVLARRRDTETRIAFLDELIRAPGWGWGATWGDPGAAPPGKDDVRPTPVTYFWHHVTLATASSLKSAGTQSPYVQATFQRNYPKLLRMVKELSEKVAAAEVDGADSVKEGRSRVRRIEDGLGSERRNVVESFDIILQPFETAYLSRSQARLYEPVQFAFPNAARAQMPTSGDADKCVRAIHSELEIARFHREFFEKIVLLVASIVGEVAKRGDAMVNHEPFAVFVPIVTSGGSGASLGTAATIVPLVNNLDLVVALWTFEEGCWKLVDEFEPPQTLEVPGSGAVVAPRVEPVGLLYNKVHSDLGRVRNVIMSVVEPLMRGLARELELVILKMHSVDYGRGGTQLGRASPAPGPTESTTSAPIARNSETSVYLSELSTKLRWITTTVFSKLSPATLPSESDEPRSWIRTLANRLVEVFLRHATMIRLRNAGRSRLANELAQFEFVVNSWMSDSSVKGGLAEGKDPELTANYRALRSLRTLLFMELSDITSARQQSHEVHEPAASSPETFLSNSPSNHSPNRTMKGTSSSTNSITALPLPLVLQHVFARSPAGTLLLPTERFSWTHQQYSDWLDSHPTDAERLTILRRSFDLYVEEVRSKGEREFCIEFPVARALLDTESS
ncbi:Conserved oligomeric Golgi complex subunit [Gonapodya sp. JEL0774]|nr:Conserved oligomeric Golgi complex subunit [Gonapodya sp. JEL0774]